jgi:hypothetical protein
MNAGTGFAILQEEHAEIHRGMAYTAGKVNTAGLADGAKFYVIGQNNNVNGKVMHVTAGFSASAAAIVRTLGGVTGRSGGQAALTYNRKTGLTDSGLDVWWGATPDSGFSTIKETYLPGGTGPQALGGDVSFRAERILAAGGTWLGLEVENVSGGVMDYFGIEWDFYLADE